MLKTVLIATIILANISKSKSDGQTILLTTEPTTTIKNPAEWNCVLPTGRYICKTPPVSNKTQAITGCQPNNTLKIPCHPLPNDDWTGFCKNVIQKSNGTEIAFYQDIGCRYTNGYKFTVALFLSVFFGLVGADRFYLGHYSLGLLKLVTAGLGGIWYAIDVILIALQIVGPVDGSFYIMDYFGPIVERFGDYY